MLELVRLSYMLGVSSQYVMSVLIYRNFKSVVLSLREIITVSLKKTTLFTYIVFIGKLEQVQNVKLNTIATSVKSLPFWISYHKCHSRVYSSVIPNW